MIEMISDKRGCFWCKHREGLKCTCEGRGADLDEQLERMGWKVDEQSLKRSLRELNEEYVDYSIDSCFGCHCDDFKGKEEGFIFR